MEKTPSTPNELLAMQADRDPVLALFELNEKLEVSTTGAQRQALALAAHLLDLHEETLKEHSKDMSTSEKVAWMDDMAALTQAVKYLGRLRG